MTLSTNPVTPATPTTPAPAVGLADVNAGYRNRVALENVSVTIPRGSLVAIFGPNGGGKSTLLKVIAGLLRPWSGTVEVLGAPPLVEAHRVAYVPQAELVDWSFPVSVWDVAMMGRYPRLGPVRRPDRSDREAVEHALERVKMADRRASQIGALSGGQRRRVFLARAIAAQPDLYLLDEPVTGVDVTTQEDLMALLKAETDLGRTAIATTHDLPAAAEHFHTVVALNRRVICFGPSSLVLDPEVLSATYGGHLLMLGSQAVVLDDAHHHDAASGPEQHFHEEGEKGSHHR
ncbi:MAG TPA: metal ABC transporter ATP-binding protein [Candidatus Limnocylindria bacterium]|nr:metal ABC transporter ATP-binding protein [Candidatus Limnocylindria bacterium]